MITIRKLGPERPLGRLLAIAAMMVFEATIPATAEPLSPISINGVFDPDLADYNHGPLEEAINIAKAQAHCYPPRATFTSVTWERNDPSFAKDLVRARKETLERYLQSLGLEPGQFDPAVQVSLIPGYGTGRDSPSDGSVRIDFDKYNKKDADPPKFQTLKSQPVKGTKVVPGQKIEVTITASERYEDGHKSWPTGVQSIQLRDDKIVIEPTGFYRPPQPCERRTLNVTYTVPKNPPPVVHLCAIVEDGVGNNDKECADFPNRRMVWHAEGARTGRAFQ